MTEKKILVVDDDELIRDGLKSFLTRLGYLVKVAEGSKEALDFIKKEEFPVIITDIKMPDIDGIKLCQSIRDLNSWSVILALSGYITEYEQERITQCGFDGYISKPANSEVLKEAVETAFDTAEVRLVEFQD